MTSPMSAGTPHIISKFTPATLVGVTEENTFPVSVEESRRQIRQNFERHHLAPFLEHVPPLGFFCSNNSVVARLQQGPTYVSLPSMMFAIEKRPEES